MKIALLHPFLDGRGGSQRYVLEIANVLKRNGNDVSIFCFFYDKHKCYPELNEGLSIYSVSAPRQASPNTELRNNQSLMFVFKKFLKIRLIKEILFALAIDYFYFLRQVAIQSHSYANLILDEFKRELGSTDILFAHEEPLSIYAAIRVKRESGIPIYWFCYDTIQKWFVDWNDKSRGSKIRSFLLNKIYFKIDKFLIVKYVDRCAVLEERISVRFFEMYGFKPLIRLGGINSAVLNMERSNFIRSKYNLSENCLVICCVTRFLPYKRIEDILSLRRNLDLIGETNVFIYINAPKASEEYYHQIQREFSDLDGNKGLVIETNNFSSDKELYQVCFSLG